jgi:hypothetical protein
MKPLIHSRAAGINDALALAGDPASAFLVGGTNELDLLRACISHSATSSTSTTYRRPVWKTGPTVDCTSARFARMSDVGSGAGLPVGPLPTPNPCVGVEHAGPGRPESRP